MSPSPHSALDCRLVSPTVAGAPSAVCCSFVLKRAPSGYLMSLEADAPRRETRQISRAEQFERKCAIAASHKGHIRPTFRMAGCWMLDAGVRVHVRLIGRGRSYGSGSK